MFNVMPCHAMSCLVHGSGCPVRLTLIMAWHW
jgi:hypothetical protein